MTLSVADKATSSAFPAQRLLHLDALWIQVAGTLCNLECAHCFVSAGPGADRHGFLSRDEVRARVAEALPLGVREFYFTGGEPFLHPDLVPILEDTLAHGPCTVLTNGTLLTGARFEALRRLSDTSRYSLEIRVSLDGWTAEAHDRIRGDGSFARAIDGIRRLERHGILPIVTATRMDDEEDLPLVERYAAMLRGAGIERPRIKLLPLFRMGREARRSRAYEAAESLRGTSNEAIDAARLPCGSCRAVTSRGVYVCPLLVDEPGGRMAGRLADALGPFELSHGACYTCYTSGMTCANG